ncbi:hypothetical protein V6C53_05350 [Desulfocurvibacter africanus]|uniref:hypothetical protein n=1 Tax=Desulfocurvibacter africanus TaxID=873 RepID=UPI002FDA98AC
MATAILVKNPQTGIVKKGLYGFSWTTFFFNGFPALFRGDIGTGLILIVLNLPTFGVAGLVWSFIYNKKYTLGLLEKGYVLAGSETENGLARQKLGILEKASAGDSLSPRTA